jgi:hypothetical protein
MFAPHTSNIGIVVNTGLHSFRDTRQRNQLIAWNSDKCLGVRSDDCIPDLIISSVAIDLRPISFHLPYIRVCVEGFEVGHDLVVIEVWKAIWIRFTRIVFHAFPQELRVAEIQDARGEETFLGDPGAIDGALSDVVCPEMEVVYVTSDVVAACVKVCYAEVDLRTVQRAWISRSEETFRTVR